MNALEKRLETYEETSVITNDAELLCALEKIIQKECNFPSHKRDLELIAQAVEFYLYLKGADTNLLRVHANNTADAILLDVSDSESKGNCSKRFRVILPVAAIVALLLAATASAAGLLIKRQIEFEDENFNFTKIEYGADSKQNESDSETEMTPDETTGTTGSEEAVFTEKTAEVFEDEQTDIFNKMLNTIDHFDSVDMTFETSMLAKGSVSEVFIQTRINEKKAFTSEKVDGILWSEQYTVNGTVAAVYHRGKTITYEHPALGREDAPYIPLSERMFVDETDGLPVVAYRANPTNSSLSSFSLFPQEMAFSYLRNFENWTVTGHEEYLGRDCTVIEGTNSSYYIEKHSVDSFKFLVDSETGVLLNFEGYLNGEKTQFTTVTAIEYGSTAEVKEFDAEQCEDYEVFNNMRP